MKQVLHFIDVAKPFGCIHPDGMTILHGDAPVWQYCVEFHKAVTQGAAVIAIGHGIEAGKRGRDSVVAYSTDPMFRIGNTIGHDYERDRLKDAQTKEVLQGCPLECHSQPIQRFRGGAQTKEVLQDCPPDCRSQPNEETSPNQT